MKKNISNFIGFLIGLLIYAGIIQYSDTDSINFTELIFDLKPWLIAFFTTAAISLWEKRPNKKEGP